MRRIALFDISSDGHHPRYAKWFIESGLAGENEVILAGPQKLIGHKELERCRAFTPFPFTLLPREQDSLAPQKLATYSNRQKLSREVTVRRVYQRVFDQVTHGSPVDLAVILCLRGCLHSIAVLGSPFGKTRWMAIDMSASFHWQSVGVTEPVERPKWLQQLIYKRVLRQRACCAILTIDPTLGDFAQRSTPAFEKLRFMYDPGEKHVLPDRAAARRVLGIPGEAFVVLCYGALSERKGIVQLLAAACDPRTGSSTHVVLAGRQSEQVREILTSGSGKNLEQQGRLHTIDRYISDDEEATVLAAADIMWAGYTDFYNMSSSIVLAARNRLPTIAPRHGVLGHLVDRYKCGFALNPSSQDEVADTLSRISRSGARRTLEQAGLRGEAAFNLYSVENTKKMIKTIAETALASGTASPRQGARKKT